MQNVLIGNRQILFFITLLILHDKVVKEDLVQFIKGFLQRNAYSLLCRLLVVGKIQFLSIVVLNNIPQLFKGKAAKRRICISFLSLQFFLLQIFINIFRDTHILLDHLIYYVLRNVFWLYSNLKILTFQLIILQLVLTIIFISEFSLQIK